MKPHSRTCQKHEKQLGLPPGSIESHSVRVAQPHPKGNLRYTVRFARAPKGQIAMLAGCGDYIYLDEADLRAALDQLADSRPTVPLKLTEPNQPALRGVTLEPDPSERELREFLANPPEPV